MRRERVLLRVVLNVVVDLWARFRACTAWMASELSTRPFTSGPRLSRGPQWITVVAAAEEGGFG